MIAGHLSCPGSLLLAGEYLVTDNGGLGLAVSVPPRASLDSIPSGQASAECLFAGGRENWKAGTDRSKSIPGIVHRRRSSDGLSATRRLTVDTTAFYHSDGRKAGYGSSAASTLLLAAGWNDSGDTGRDELGQFAVECHREFQGGRGSGYDILCSLYGGFGLFSGGFEPRWRSLAWPSGLNGWIIPGAAPVSSADAVSRYKEWQRGNPAECEEFRKETGHVLTAMAGIPAHSYSQRIGSPDPLNLPEPTSRDLVRVLGYLGDLARRLGAMIGVPAEPVLPRQLKMLCENRDGLTVKCLGAGDELALVLACTGALDPAEESLLDELVRKGQAAVLEPDFQGLEGEAG